MPHPWILFLWICPVCGYVLPGLRGALAVESPAHGHFLGAKNFVRMLQEASTAFRIGPILSWTSPLPSWSLNWSAPHSNLERVAGGGLLQGPSQATALKLERTPASTDRCCQILAKGLGHTVGHNLHCSGHQISDSLAPRTPT